VWMTPHWHKYGLMGERGKKKEAGQGRLTESEFGRGEKCLKKPTRGRVGTERGVKFLDREVTD